MRFHSKYQITEDIDDANALNKDTIGPIDLNVSSYSWEALRKTKRLTAAGAAVDSLVAGLETGAIFRICSLSVLDREENLSVCPTTRRLQIDHSSHPFTLPRRLSA